MYVGKGQHEWQKLKLYLKDINREGIQEHRWSQSQEQWCLQCWIYLIGPSNHPSREGFLLYSFYTEGKLRVEQWQCPIQDYRISRHKKMNFNPSNQISRTENSLKCMLNVEISQKTKNRVAIWSSNATPGHIIWKKL